MYVHIILSKNALGHTLGGKHPEQGCQILLAQHNKNGKNIKLT
jgi:hypothetical protein